MITQYITQGGVIKHGSIGGPSNCIQPPHNLNIAALTDTQIDAYGFPPRKLFKNISEWKAVVQAAKVRVCKGTSSDVRFGRNIHPIKRNGIGPLYNYWGGYEAYAGGYTNAYTEYTHPCVYTPYPPSSSVGFWIGLDGDDILNPTYNTVLVQAGTFVESNSAGNSTQNYAFIEDVPDDPTAVVAFPVNCNDTIFTYVWQEFLNGNPYKAHMYVQDLSTGHYFNAYNTNAFSNGSTAEWITEMTEFSSGLINFKRIEFYDDYAIQYGNHVAASNTVTRQAIIEPGSFAFNKNGPLNYDGYSNTSYFYDYVCFYGNGYC